jgi:UDP-N-acetylmuramyl tripeptide synthase
MRAGEPSSPEIVSLVAGAASGSARRDVHLNLPGRFQADNVLLAAGLVRRALGPRDES